MAVLKCGNCKFFKGADEICVKYPPRFHPTLRREEEMYGAFPKVVRTWVCGEYIAEV